MSRRRFGCEFEFSASWKKVETAVRSSVPKSKLEVDQVWLRSEENSKWILKTDSTTSAELTTPICRPSDLSFVCDVARRLSRHGLYITRRDGFHVHVAALSNAPLKMAKAWMDYEEAILSMFPAHRRENDMYCKRYVEDGRWIKDEKVTTLVNDHHAVMSFSRLNTFEFRICEGTLDPKWVGVWVRLCLAFVGSTGAYKPQRRPLSLENLMKRLRVPHRDYLLCMGRKEKFSSWRV